MLKLDDIKFGDILVGKTGVKDLDVEREFYCVICVSPDLDDEENDKRFVLIKSQKHLETRILSEDVPNKDRQKWIDDRELRVVGNVETLGHVLEAELKKHEET